MLFKIFLFLNLGTHQEKKTANLKSEKIHKKQEKKRYFYCCYLRFVFFNTVNLSVSSVFFVVEKGGCFSLRSIPSGERNPTVKNQLFFPALHYITLHYITLHYITLHYIARTFLFCITFYITLHYIIHTLFFPVCTFVQHLLRRFLEVGI